MNVLRLSKIKRAFSILFPAALALMTVVANPGSATGTPVTIAITATVRLVDDPANILGNEVRPGDAVTGTYTYDLEASDSNPVSDNIGIYRSNSAPYGVQLAVNGLTFKTDPTNVDFLLELVNDYNARDNYQILSYNNLFDVSASGSSVRNTIAWQLDDPTQTALSSSMITPDPPVLSEWQSIFGLDIMSSGNNRFLIRSDVTSAVLIPEPSSFALIASGSGLVFAYCRRRKRLVRPFESQIDGSGPSDAR